MKEHPEKKKVEERKRLSGKGAWWGVVGFWGGVGHKLEGKSEKAALKGRGSLWDPGKKDPCSNAQKPSGN